MSDNSEMVIFKETTTDNELFCQFDDHYGVLLLDVKNPFNAEDFETIAEMINPYFKEHGKLKGVIIHAKKFPYWKGYKNRQEYLNFVIVNHRKFEKAALAMGGFFTRIIAQLAKGRVHPEVKTFRYRQIEKAQDWILASPKKPSKR